MKRFTFILSALLACQMAGQQTLDEESEAEVRRIMEKRENAWKTVFMEHRVSLDGTVTPGVIELEALSPDIPRGDAVGLYADTQDQSEWMTVVYVLNPTRETFRNGISGVYYPIKQVRTATGWENAWPLVHECGVGIEWSADLDAGQAWHTGGESAAKGDAEGDLRFLLPVSGGRRPLVSQTFRGRYRTDGIHSCRDLFTAPLGARFSFVTKDWKRDETDWGYDSYPATTREECIAALRILGKGDPCWRARGDAERFLASGKGGQQDSVEFAAAVRELIAGPWSDRREDGDMFQACLAALQATDGGSAKYGAPAGNRAVVWKILSTYEPLDDLAGPERWDEVQILQASGNPWGATAEDLERVVALARNALAGDDVRVARAAGNFLSCRWIPEGAMPAAEFGAYLNSAFPVVRRTGFFGLVARGQGDTAGRWLAGMMDTSRDEAVGLMEEHSRKKGYSAIEEWEAAPLAAMLERRLPLALKLLGGRCQGTARPSRSRLIPEALHGPLAAFLASIADSPGEVVPPDCLSALLTLVHFRQDPEDDLLFVKYLECPLWTQTFRRGEIRRYDGRATALKILTSRGATIPVPVVLQEPYTAEKKGR